MPNDKPNCSGTKGSAQCKLRANCSKYNPDMPIHPMQSFIMMPSGAAHGKCPNYKYDGKPLVK